jgi:hypothetical protein
MAPLPKCLMCLCVLLTSDLVSSSQTILSKIDEGGSGEDLDDSVYASGDTAGSTWQAKAKAKIQHEKDERAREQAQRVHRKKAERDAHVWALAEKERLRKQDSEDARFALQESTGETEKDLREFSSRPDVPRVIDLETWELSQAQRDADLGLRTERAARPRSLVRRQIERNVPVDSGVYGDSLGRYAKRGPQYAAADDSQSSDAGNGVFAGGNEEKDASSSTAADDTGDDSGTGVLAPDPTDGPRDTEAGASSSGAEAKMADSEADNSRDAANAAFQHAATVASGLGPRNAGHVPVDSGASAPGSFLQIFSDGRAKAWASKMKQVMPERNKAAKAKRAKLYLINGQWSEPKAKMPTARAKPRTNVTALSSKSAAAKTKTKRATAKPKAKATSVLQMKAQKSKAAAIKTKRTPRALSQDKAKAKAKAQKQITVAKEKAKVSANRAKAKAKTMKAAANKRALVEAARRKVVKRAPAKKSPIRRVSSPRKQKISKSTR